MKNYLIELKWALLFVIMMLTWMWMEKVAGLHDIHINKHAIYTNFVAIPAIAIYVLALLDKRKNFYHGAMTFRQGFRTGLIITLIVTLFSPLMQYVTSTWITPDYFSNVISFAVSQGEMSQQEAQEYFNLKNYILQSFIGSFVMGLVTTLIVALLVKRGRKFSH